MNRYQRGHRVELKAKKLLEDQGYLVVRSAGSKGPVDLVAVKKDDVRLVQIKRTHCSSILRITQDVLSRIPKELWVSVEVWVWVKNKGFQVFRWSDLREVMKNCSGQTKRSSVSPGST